MTKNKKGFTIIEVVLVLAIAGLIFLMVFIALPALQRSQRNTQREDDISRFLTAANDFQTNNNGKTPWQVGDSTTKKKTAKNFVKRYIDSSCTAETPDEQDSSCGAQFTDPDGEPYFFRPKGDAANDDAAVMYENGEDDGKVNHAIVVYSYSSCGDEGYYTKGTGTREYSMFYVLEGGSVTCDDNH